MNWKAARTSAALSVLFLIVYCSSNWAASKRQHVPSFYFAFERHIPFVPLFIVPYLSIDLFFLAAPFVCRDDSQRRRLARRLVLSILIAGAFFFFLPLRFHFERPAAPGWLGVVFGYFRNMDLPFNQFPSLHIAMLLILAPVYTSAVGRTLRCVLWIWFCLIALSTLLTYQHHLIDLIGGAALAVFCFYLVPEAARDRFASSSNYRVGSYYLCGAMGLAAAGFALRPIGFLMFWPAVSLAIAAVGYFGAGASIYHKQQGKLPWATILLLWPVLLGQHLSLLHYRRQCSAWDALTDRVWIGRKLNASEARNAIAAGVRAVLDLTGEFSEAEPFLSLDYLQLPIMDLTAPTAAQVDRAVEFITSHAAYGVVYIHCKIGYSRTAAVAGAYLLSIGQARNADDAAAQLRAARPPIIIRREAMGAIRNYKVTDVIRSETML